MEKLLFLVGIVGIALIIITLIKKTHNKSDTETLAIEDKDLEVLKQVQFKPKPIMTNAELKFFHILTVALHDCYVFPQVATHSILSCYHQNHSYKTKAFNKFKSTSIDYVICDKSFNILAVIELDDKTHEHKKDKDDIRDAMLCRAGYQIHRFNCKKIGELTPALIRNTILNEPLQ